MTLLLLYLLYPCSPMLLSYDSPFHLLTLLYYCCCFHWSDTICRTLLPRNTMKSASGVFPCHLPTPMLLPTSSPYCYCCCCRCCVGATPFFLYQLLCPILAAGVLLLCYVVAAEALLFSPYSSPWNHPPPYATRFSDNSSSFRQTPDVPTFLHFIVICVS